MNMDKQISNSQSLETKLGEALTHSVSLKEIHSYEAEENNIIQQFLYQVISGDQFEIKLDKLNRKQNHRVVCQTMEDFELVLEYLGISQREKAEIRAWAGLISQDALKLRLQTRFTFSFCETDGGKFVILAIQIEVDPGLPDTLKRKTLHMIATRFYPTSTPYKTLAVSNDKLVI